MLTSTTIFTLQFDNLISDIGGQLGLWIGVSAVTCVEFLALIYSLCCRLTLKRKAAKNSVDADKDAL